ncbi:MAG: helix-turn-helix transcriptional regulator, partial [Bacteroidota bacterium]
QGEKTNSLNPVELLRHLMKESNLSQTNLAREIDVSPQLISDVLAYRRNISKDMVVKLATHFAMQQEAFSRPYSLTNDQKSKAKG